MVKIKSVSAKSILDSREEKTILVKLSTNIGVFSASAPNGKSRGKFEAKPYKESLKGDIKKIEQLGDYFKDEIIENFNDLRRAEDILEGNVGANTFFAFESALLKALSKERKEDIWKIINPNAKNFPRLVGNVIGGGKHTDRKNRPDFQEFLLIPNSNSVKKSLEILENSKQKVKTLLERYDKKFKAEKNDEDAFITSLKDKEILDVLNQLDVPIGLDIAASEFYRRKKYYYQNPMLNRTENEQVDYLSNLIKNLNIFYIEDPFEQESFSLFSELKKKFPDRLIVGDDLTTTNPQRFLRAIKKGSINALIVKPNQIGSLMKVREVCEMAKKNNIKIVFSHRSGETKEDILADLAFGFGADFFKSGITGVERKIKINRLIEIEKKIKK
jgi:enolase